MSAYKALERRFSRLSGLGHALSVLSWDRQVVMPPGANAGRGGALSRTPPDVPPFQTHAS